MTRETPATSAQSLTGKGLTVSQVSAGGARCVCVCVCVCGQGDDDDDDEQEEEREAGRGGQEQKSSFTILISHDHLKVTHQLTRRQLLLCLTA